MELQKNPSFLFTLFFISLAFAAIGQTKNASLRGTVRDAGQKPIASASIALKGTSIVTETNDSGEFKLNAPSGKYQLVVSRLGFKPYKQQIELVAQQELTLPVIVLADWQQMQDVQISGKTKAKTVKEEAYNVNVLDTKQLYNTSADLNQALNKTSGIRIREDGGVGSNFTFSLNGFSGKQVKFFLDGIPMDNFGSSLTLNNFPVNMAERVEIYKGVVPISLGTDALGGAVNIVTRSNPNYLDVTYGYGSFNTHKASVNHAYTNEKTGFTIRTNAFYNYSDNDYKVSVEPIDILHMDGRRLPRQEVRRFHDGYQSISAQIEAGVTDKKYTDKLLIGLIASGNWKDIQTGVTMDQVFGARTTRFSTLIPTLKYKKDNLFTKGLDVSLYTAYNMSKNHFIDTTRLNYNWLQQTVPSSTAELRRSQLENQDNEALATANIAYRLGEHHTLSFNYLMNDFRRKSSDVEDPENITFLYPQKLNKQVLGLAWQEKYDGFTATIFAKQYLLNAKSFEKYNDRTSTGAYRESSTNVSKSGYGAAATYFILPQLQAKASYEHTYRLPEALELLGDGLYIARNSALKPENSDNFNLGALYSFQLNETNKFNVEANYIFRNSHDFIRLDQQQVKPVDRQYINIGDVQTNGVEGDIKYSWKNKFHASLNITYQNIIDKQETLYSETFQGTVPYKNLNYGYRIPNTPYLFGNADLGYLFNHVGGARNALDVSYSLNFVEKYYLTPHQLGSNNDDIIPTQFSHNLMANYQIGGGKYNVALECRNFTNNQLFDNYGLQKPGRSFFIKLRYFISK